jgi:hypothetical protein
MTITVPYVRGPAVAGSQAVNYPSSAGQVVHNRFTANIGPSAAIGTTIGIGVIPPGCRVVDAVLESSVVGAGVTANVGVITDSRNPPAPPGSNSAADLAARTVGSEFFAAASIAAASAARMTAPGGFAVAPKNYEQEIGLVTAGAISAATVQTVTLSVWLAAA